MDILDNARIIKQLTDKEDVWELWQILCGINRELDEARHKIECIRDGKDCDDCEEWCFISTDRLLSIPDTSIMKQQVESLNLEALHTWLIDESTSKEDLQFRLNKIQGIVGSMWSKDDYVKVWCLLNGFKPTPNFEVGKEWEIKKGIIPTKSLSNQIYEVATQLDRTQSEDEIDKMVMRLNKVLLDWFKVVGFILGETYSMIEEAEQILNPQPTQTETELQSNMIETSKEQKDPDIIPNKEFLPNEYVDKAFELAVTKHLIERQGEVFKWIAERELLPYFCEHIYESVIDVIFSNKYDKRWECFSGWFIVKRSKGKHKGEELPADAKYIRRQKEDWYKRHHLDKTEEFKPRRRQIVDRIVEKIVDKMMQK